MIGVDIDFVVPDCLEALALYERIFDVKRIEVTAFPRGNNEAIFSLYGTRFHMLDENPECHLVAPKPGDPKPIWFNVMVPDIAKAYQAAMEAGFSEIQGITELPAMGVSNAILVDPYGHVWMLHQVHREVSFEERVRIMEASCAKPKE
jgi:PhnB protein